MITFSSARWVSLLKGKRGKMVMEPNKDNSSNNNNKWRISSKNSNVSSGSSDVRDWSRIYAIPSLKRGGVELCWQFFSTKGKKRKTQSRRNANVGLLQTQAGSNDDRTGDKRGATIYVSKETVVRVEGLLHVLHQAVRKRRRACLGQIDRNPLWSPASLTKAICSITGDTEGRQMVPKDESVEGTNESGVKKKGNKQQENNRHIKRPHQHEVSAL